MAKGNRIDDLEVIPDHVHIGDIEGDIGGGKIATFKPLGYGVTMGIAPFAMVKLIKWAIRTRVVILNGELYYRKRTKIERIKGNG